MLIDPNDVNVIYVSTGIFDREAANSDPATNTPGGVGVLKSIDGGQTWNEANTGLLNLYIGSLFMHPDDSQILLLGAGNNAYRRGGGAYYTSDGADHWEYLIGSHITSVEFAVSDLNIAYAAGADEFFRWEKKDSGQNWESWERMANGAWGPQGTRVGFSIDFQVDLRDPMRIFVNSYGGGNFLSEDGGKTWRASSIGYTGADLTDITVHPETPSIIYANGRSGPFKSIDGGLTTSENGGQTWVRQAGTALDAFTVTEIVVHPHDEDIAWAATAGGGVFMTVDGGETWVPKSDGLWSMFIMDLASDFGNSMTLYAGTADRGLFISRDGGDSWLSSSAGMDPNEPVGAIVVDPMQPNVIYAGSWRSGVYRSEDGGARWQLLNEGLRTRSERSLAISSDGETLYAATRAERASSA